MLKDRPDLWDVGSIQLCEEIQRRAKNANRYRELLGLPADNQLLPGSFVNGLAKTGEPLFFAVWE
jgi:hypothetical protein